MSKERILFVCIHNSARSQMAEELLKKLASDRFEVESAGLEPGQLNPFVVQVLKEDDGIDISAKKPQSVFDLLQDGRQYDYVVTVCDETQSERCPVFPGKAKRIHWGFADPSRFEGVDDDRLKQVRAVKKQIESQLEQWLRS